jgi:predicted nuclease of predicted toxin-antitoxin system
VKEVKLENESDVTIWEYARDNNFCIFTFDADFIDISNLRGSPPKIIWLRIGNTSTYEISNRIREEADSISEFLNNSELAFLEIC